MLEFKGLLCFSTNSFILQLTVYFTLHTFRVDFSLYNNFRLNRWAEFQLVPILQQELINLVILWFCTKSDFAHLILTVTRSFIYANPKWSFK